MSDEMEPAKKRASDHRQGEELAESVFPGDWQMEFLPMLGHSVVSVGIDHDANETTVEHHDSPFLAEQAATIATLTEQRDRWRDEVLADEGTAIGYAALSHKWDKTGRKCTTCGHVFRDYASAVRLACLDQPRHDEHGVPS